MPKPTDITIRSAECAFEPVTFRTPLKFGGRVMDKGHLINVTVEVETRNGKHAAGVRQHARGQRLVVAHGVRRL
jgi:hypothetical protein